MADELTQALNVAREVGIQRIVHLSVINALPAAGAVRKLEEILGRPMRTYQAFVAEQVKKHR